MTTFRRTAPLFRTLARLALLAQIAAATTPALAGPPQWYSQIYTPNTNSQISLTDANNTSVTAITNPTAASVKVNANMNTQPPTIIVQATAGLPIKTIGTACVTGTDTAALSAADKLTLLTCGASNTWQITNRVALQTVVAGAACNVTTDGNIAVDSSGIQLSCQYNGAAWVWTSRGIGYQENGDLTAFSYVGSSGTLQNYCISRTLTVASPATFMGSVNTQGWTAKLGAELAVWVILDGVTIGSNLTIPQYVPGLQFTSASGMRAMTVGSHTATLCIAANTSDGSITSPWTAAYAIATTR